MTQVKSHKYFNHEMCGSFTIRDVTKYHLVLNNFEPIFYTTFVIIPKREPSLQVTHKFTEIIKLNSKLSPLMTTHHYSKEISGRTLCEESQKTQLSNMAIKNLNFSEIYRETINNQSLLCYLRK